MMTQVTVEMKGLWEVPNHEKEKGRAQRTEARVVEEEVG